MTMDTLKEKSMTSSTPLLETDPRTEDVLAQLPVATTTQYRKGHAIYGPDRLSDRIYLVMGILHIAGNGAEVLLEIVRPDELFGESAFLHASRRSERATAIETARLMTWAVSEMQDLVMKRPRLAVALLQILAQRNFELTRRIESFSVDNVERRLARSLIRFSERLGAPEPDGSVRIMPLTHEMLSRYVGTSRGLVTQCMNRFRKRGYVSYSRNGILLNPDVLKASIS
jgi:CRP/FNR family transcriptional regulator